MRVSEKKVNQYLEKQLFRMLHQTIADLKTTEEVEEFLTSFLSDAEHITLAKRVAVVYWLDKGRGYGNIRDNLKVSSATIASIQSSMQNRGVKIALRKIKAEEWATYWASKIRKFVNRK